MLAVIVIVAWLGIYLVVGWFSWRPARGGGSQESQRATQAGKYVRPS